jgi:pilus assembly protein FimV
MSNGKNPLMLMMALAVPGAAQALGLGDIHVDSALNERLAAEIDIVGATAAELENLRAAVANRETFLHFGADRPAFLSSATFNLGQDSRGRPVLVVRSTDAFTEPLVNFVVDLRWGNGQLVRQYTLLLDPPGFAAAPPAAPVVETKTQTVARQAEPPADQVKSGDRAVRKTTHIKVGAKATLRGVAWRVGERSESDLQKMMIAIFRANPSAFDGNINRLHLGAVLTIPSYAKVAAISREEAKREVHLQMAAWRAPDPATSIPVAAVAAAAPPTDELDRRVQSLEHELVEVQGLLQSQRGKLLGMEQQVALAEKTAPIAEAPRLNAPGAAAPFPPKSGNAPLVPIAGGFGLLAGALAALYFRLRRRATKPGTLPLDTGIVPAAAIDGTLGGVEGAAHSTTEEHVTTEDLVARGDHAGDDAARDARDDSHVDASLDDAATQEIAAPVFEDTHPMILVPAALTTHLDYNLPDPTAQHVQMPSVLNEHAVVKERRTNLAGVLKLAIEREPDRHDLRMKLLELYYSAAATNRKAFLEVVQRFADDRDYLNTDQWDKIASMGRQIASDNPLFAEESASDEDLADCA